MSWFPLTDGKRNAGKKKTALLATAYNPDVSVMDAPVKHYEMTASYMQWEDAGKVLACGWGRNK